MLAVALSVAGVETPHFTATSVAAVVVLGVSEGVSTLTIGGVALVLVGVALSRSRSTGQ
jgi:hypothetical protein